MLTLILGGTRSGKSRYAEQIAVDSGKKIKYLATATAGDNEMRQRIDRHRQDRPDQWQTIEEPVRLANTLIKHSTDQHCIVVECLTLWLSNILFDRQGNFQQAVFENETEELLRILSFLPGPVIMVSNEVGLGVVAVSQSTRRFVDEAGRLHQKLAQQCNRVVLMTAGLAQILK